MDNDSVEKGGLEILLAKSLSVIPHLEVRHYRLPGHYRYRELEGIARQILLLQPWAVELSGNEPW